ncbi:MAG: SUMF1/EgtB/PvdO family nonheme iron enzyme, partial [Kiritimatiellaeota bacterium]|nr:SUMF1/EgtB/PvdO family nonheme iron enzyme [Kiritimatiellota bacterium]
MEKMKQLVGVRQVMAFVTLAAAAVAVVAVLGVAGNETPLPITGIKVQNGNVLLSWDAMDPTATKLYEALSPTGKWWEVTSPIAKGASGATVAADAPSKFFRLYLAAEPTYGFSLTPNAPYTFASEALGYVSLLNGVPLQGIVGEYHASTNFVIYVPHGATQLYVATGGGSGDVDLYIVDPATGIEHSSTSASNVDSLTFANPVAGYWFIRLYAYGAYTTTLTATITGGADQGAPSLTVTLENTGNQAGVFALSSSSNAFVVTPSTLSVAGGASDTFTVAPAAGLPRGTYTATITADGGEDFGTESFEVFFTVVNPNAHFALSQEAAYAFDDDVGYDPLPPLSVTIHNTGGQGGTFAVSSSSGAFAVSVPSVALAGGASGTFTVAPVAGLGQGTYFATVTVDGGTDYDPQSFEVSFTVNPAYALAYAADPAVTWDRVGHTLRIDLDTYDVLRLPKNFNVASDPAATTNALYLRYIRPGRDFIGMSEVEFSQLSSALPRRLVTLTEGYYIGVYPLTEAQYERIMGTGDVSSTPKRGVSWNELRTGDAGTEIAPTDAPLAPGLLGTLGVNVFAASGLSLAFDLPTEAQWEAACRAGALGTLPNSGNTIVTEATIGDFWNWLTLIANPFASNVGGKAGNNAGLYDVLGNVYEWCRDIHLPTAYSVLPATDPLGTGAAGALRAIRGGDASNSSVSRPAWRATAVPTSTGINIGVRISATGAAIAAPEYGFTLSQRESHAFAVNGSLSVDLANVGFQGGSFAVSSSSAAFTVSPSSLAVASGAFDTFTVAPAPGLAAGSYTATITADGGANYGTKTFDVSFTSDYTFTLSQGVPHEFATNAFGYGAVAPLSVTLSNAGTQHGTFAVSSSSANFTVSPSPLAVMAGAGDTFTVAPNPGLASGTYTATITADGGVGFGVKTFDVSFTVLAQVHTFALSQTETHTFPLRHVGTNIVGYTTLQNGVTLSGLSGGEYSTVVYALYVPASMAQLTVTVTVTGSSYAPGLYLRHGELASSYFYDYRSETPANTSSRTITVNNPAPGYWYIALSPERVTASAYSNGTLVATYGAAPFPVTLSNTGNQGGSFALSSSDVNFTVSPPALSVAAGASDTFTVTPAADLPVGTHTAVITADGGSDYGIKTFAVSLTVEDLPPPTFNFTLSQTVPHTFATRGSWTNVVGYTAIVPGVGVSSLAAGAGGAHYRVLYVPSSATQMQVSTSGGTGNATLYVRRGAAPTTVLYDAGSWNAGNSQNITINDPDEGYWYIMVFGNDAYSGVGLTASFDETPLTVTIENTGDVGGTFAIATSDGSFALSPLSRAVAGGASDTFTVIPHHNLVAGTYAATITVDGGANFGSKAFDVAFTVNPPDPPPSYGFTLDRAGAYTFATNGTGYASVPPIAVAINNTGTEAGTFAVSSSSANFTVSSASVAVAGGVSGAFTVAPVTGLAAGTHTATITVDGGANFGSKAFTVSFRVEAYTFTLNRTTPYDFGSVALGYAAQAPLSVSINNTGTVGGVFALSSSSAAFTVSPSSYTLAAGAGNTFTVVPVTGLAAGTYTATITADDGADFGTKTFDVSFTVNPTSHTFTVSQTAAHSFGSATAGYGARTPLTVTINNTGTMGGTFAITSSSVNFAVSPSSRAITAGSANTFTVAPVTGLPSGNYTAIITVDGGSDFGKRSFAVSFVVDTYTFTLSQTTAHTFASAYPGYAAQTPLTVTLNNTGTQSGTFALTSSSANFTVSPASRTVAAGASDTFTVTPVAGLLTGTYSATITANGGANFGSKTFTVSFTIVNPYTFDISQIAPCTFPTNDVGYGALAPLTVTVTNTGIFAATFALASSDAAFALSTNEIVLAAGAGGTFTVVPVTGLARGDYAATISADGGTGFGTKAFDVAFRVNAYAFGVSQTTAHAFPTNAVGYSAPTPLTVTVTNTGDYAGTFALSSSDAAFALSAPTLTLAAGAGGTFTVASVTGLARGDYAATITADGGANYGAKAFAVSFRVNEYGFALTPTTTHTFPTNDVGYAALTPLTVTVTNTGDYAGTFTLASTDAAFALSAPTLTLAAGAGGTFTVVPATGLARGAYAATISADGGAGFGAKTFDVAFTVKGNAFTLSQTAPYNFAFVNVGYAAQTPLAVTLANTGDYGGTFTLSSSSANFTVTPSTLSVASGANDTFAVAPVTGLPLGTYTATITADGGTGYGTKTFTVSFTVNTYSFALSQTTPHAFPSDDVGYAPITPLTVTVTNTGDYAGTFALSSSDAAFTLSTNETILAAGAGDTFTVTPATGLARGAYAATITADGGANYGTKTFAVSFTVKGNAFAVSQTTPHTFPTNNVGYSALTPITVTVTNTGDYAGTFTLSSSDAAFTLSAPTLTLAAGAGGTFTVAPVTGLVRGDYAATITADGGTGFGTKAFDVAFRVNAYDFGVSQTTTHTFPTNAIGYGAVTPITVTVTNTGDYAGTFALTTSDAAFTLSTNELVLAAGTAGTFTIAPVTGLAAATYTATVTVNGGANYGTKAFDVAFTVNDVPTYTFTLSPTGSYIFPPHYAGSPAPTPLTVTITNTGNQDGTFAITRSVLDFTVSPASRFIAAGASDTFTVTPFGSLDNGKYFSTVVTVNGGANFGTRTLGVSLSTIFQPFAASPTGVVHTFPTNTVGYASVPPVTITVTNMGAFAGTFTIIPPSPANFVPSVSTLTLAAGASDTFTVAPATGLAAGTY